MTAGSHKNDGMDAMLPLTKEATLASGMSNSNPVSASCRLRHVACNPQILNPKHWHDGMNSLLVYAYQHCSDGVLRTFRGHHICVVTVYCHEEEHLQSTITPRLSKPSSTPKARAKSVVWSAKDRIPMHDAGGMEGRGSLRETQPHEVRRITASERHSRTRSGGITVEPPTRRTKAIVSGRVANHAHVCVSE
jgi:hypothetical protein